MARKLDFLQPYQSLANHHRNRRVRRMLHLLLEKMEKARFASNRIRSSVIIQLRAPSFLHNEQGIISH